MTRVSPRRGRWLRIAALLVFAGGGIASSPRFSVKAAEAEAPVVSLTPQAARIQIARASLADAIDTLARTAGFKVTYEGPRPNTLLFNAAIETPTVAQTLFRLLEGQNLNYGVVLDRTGKKVTLLMVLGPTASTGTAAGSGATPARPQPFTTPRPTRVELPPVAEDSTDDVEPEGAPEATPSPAASPVGPIRGGGPPSPFPPSPFGPRSPFMPPFGPRPSPTPSP